MPIVFTTLYFPFALEMIWTEVLPERFFNFRTNTSKNRFATPKIKTQSSKIKGFRGRFSKVRKTGGRYSLARQPWHTPRSITSDLFCLQASGITAAAFQLLAYLTPSCRARSRRWQHGPLIRLYRPRLPARRPSCPYPGVCSACLPFRLSS